MAGILLPDTGRKLQAKGKHNSIWKRPSGRLSVESREEQNTNFHCQEVLFFFFLSFFNIFLWVFGFPGSKTLTEL